MILKLQLSNNSLFLWNTEYLLCVLPVHTLLCTTLFTAVSFPCSPRLAGHPGLAHSATLRGLLPLCVAIQLCYTCHHVVKMFIQPGFLVSGRLSVRVSYPCSSPVYAYVWRILRSPSQKRFFTRMNLCIIYRDGVLCGCRTSWKPSWSWRRSSGRWRRSARDKLNLYTAQLLLLQNVCLPFIFLLELLVLSRLVCM